MYINEEKRVCTHCIVVSVGGCRPNRMRPKIVIWYGNKEAIGNLGK